MKVELLYKGNSQYEFRHMAVLWLQGQVVLEMEKTESGWIKKLELSPGKYDYRFLINGELELTDPCNTMLEQDEEGKVWSLIKIDEMGKRVFQKEFHNIDMDNYSLWNGLLKEPLFTEKKSFHIGEDEKVAARFAFRDIVGLHSIVVAWSSPEGGLFQYAENVLHENDNEAAYALWFWIDLEEIEKREGMWKLHLFIDGRHILEDSFSLYS